MIGRSEGVSTSSLTGRRTAPEELINQQDWLDKQTYRRIN